MDKHIALSKNQIVTSLQKPAAEFTKDERLVAFLDSISQDACNLFLLGDILDYWFEYKTVVPRGYVRFFGALARLADSGVRVVWFIGKMTLSHLPFNTLL